MPERTVLEVPEPLLPVFRFLPMLPGVVRVLRVGMRLRSV
jgi:hypothetical protein